MSNSLDPDQAKHFAIRERTMAGRVNLSLEEPTILGI